MIYPSAATYNALIRDRDRSTFATLASWNWWTAGGSVDNFIQYEGMSSLICKAGFGSRLYALKLFTSHLAGRQKHYEKIAKHLQEARPSWTTHVDVLKKEISVGGDNYPIVLYNWTDGVPMPEYIDSILDDNCQLSILQQKIVGLSRELERCLIGHGNLEPDNILVTAGTDNPSFLVPVDYDAMIVPSNVEDKKPTPRGSLQHPRRAALKMDYRIDRFPVWCMLCAIEALKWDKSLWNPVSKNGFNMGNNLLFTENDFKFFDQSVIIQHLYALNIEPLNFYLYALNRFVHSLSNYVEEPEVHGEEIDLNHDEFPFDQEVEEKVHPVLKERAVNTPESPVVVAAAPAIMVDNQLTSAAVESDSEGVIVSNERATEYFGSSVSWALQLGLIVAGVIFAVVAIYSLSSNSGKSSSRQTTKTVLPVINNGTDSQYTNRYVRQYTIPSLNIDESIKNFDESLKKYDLDTASIRHYTDSMMKVMTRNLDHDRNASSAIEKVSITVTGDTQRHVAMIDSSAGENIVADPGTSITAEEAGAKKEVILNFFDLVRNKRTEDAWELVSEGVYKKMGKTWFMSEKGYGYIWEIETDEITLLYFSDTMVEFRVKYYTYHIYEGPKCFDQRIQLKKMSGDDDWWIINSMKNVTAPVKCDKR